MAVDFTETELQTLAATLRKAAGTEILPRFRRLRTGAIRQKSGPLDLVTDADEAAEEFMTRELERIFPGVLVVGEEAASADASLIARLAAAEFAIVLDPIDGTANFAAGLPLFGVMAAVAQRGQTIAAIILDPIVDSFSAARLGQGAREHAADGSVAKLHVAAPVPLDAMTGMISWRYMAPEMRAHVLRALPRVAQLWDHRCAAHEYRALIAGHSSFVIFNRLMPWDHLAGVLLTTEAGGYVARFDGSAYAPGDTEGGLICATDEASWQALRVEIVGHGDHRAG